YSLGDRGSSIRASLPPNAEFDGVNMLALDAPRLMVGTGTGRHITSQIDGVCTPRASLRRNNPHRTFSSQLHRCCDVQSSFFAWVHESPSLAVIYCKVYSVSRNIPLDLIYYWYHTAGMAKVNISGYRCERCDNRRYL